MKNHNIKAFVVIVALSGALIKPSDWFDNYYVESTTKKARQLKEANRKNKARIQNLKEFKQMLNQAETLDKEIKESARAGIAIKENAEHKLSTFQRLRGAKPDYRPYKKTLDEIYEKTKNLENERNKLNEQIVEKFDATENDLEYKALDNTYQYFIDKNNINKRQKVANIKSMWQKKLQQNSVLYSLSPRLYNWWYSK